MDRQQMQVKLSLHNKKSHAIDCLDNRSFSQKEVLRSKKLTPGQKVNKNEVRLEKALSRQCAGAFFLPGEVALWDLQPFDINFSGIPNNNMQKPPAITGGFQ